MSNLQYDQKKSPMEWLHLFSISNENKYLITILNTSIFKSMLGEQTNALELVHGYWDQEIATQLKIVEEDFGSEKEDFIDLEATSQATKKPKDMFWSYSAYQ